MTDNELLLAISNMLDPIREDIRDLRDDVRELREDIRKIEERVSEIEERVNEIEERVCEIDERLKKVELMQENVVIPRLQNIEACYTSTFERYKSGVEEHMQIKEDVSLIKQVVLDYSEKLKKIS